MHRHRMLAIRTLGIAALIAVAACQDTVSPTAKTRQPQLSHTILDGAHNGNKSVFFLPPMVSNPNGQPGFGDPPQGGLPVSFTILRLFRSDITDCGTTNAVIKQFSTTDVQFQTDHYQAIWHTDDSNLNPNCTYRIEVLVGSQIEAFADVDVVSSGSQLKRVDTQEYIPLLDGRTLPINVRIEKGVTFCTDPSCVSQVVPDNATTLVTTPNGENAAQFPPNWFDATVLGTDQVIVTIEDITSQVNAAGGVGCGLGVTTMVSSDAHCVRFSTQPEVTSVTATVIVAVCQENREDLPQLLLKYDVDETPTFLRNVPSPITCPEDAPVRTSDAKGVGRALQLASAAFSHLGRAMHSALVPRDLYAFDQGVGGAIDLGGGFSVISAGHPIAMDPIAPTTFTGIAGQILSGSPTVELRFLHVTDPDVLGPANAVVTCTVVPTNGVLRGHLVEEGDELQGQAEPDEETPWVYHCPQWRPDAGTNTLKVTAAGVDDVVIVEGAKGPFAGTATFTAVGTIPGGNDLVVLGDANIFDDVAGADPNNLAFFGNLLNYQTTAARSSGSHVIVRCDNSTPVNNCPGNKFKDTLQALGYAVDYMTAVPAVIPANVKEIIFAPTAGQYATTEVSALQQFANNGGRVVVLAEVLNGDVASGVANLNAVRASLALTPVPTPTGTSQFGCPSDGSSTFAASVLAGSTLTFGLNQLAVNCASEVDLSGNGFGLFYVGSDPRHIIGAVFSVPPIIQ